MIVPQSGGDNSDVSVDTDSDYDGDKTGEDKYSDDEDGGEAVDDEDSDDVKRDKAVENDRADDNRHDGTDEDSDDEEVEATQTWPEGYVKRPFG